MSELQLTAEIKAAVIEAVQAEMSAAGAKYGPFTSTHEGYGVLAEEVAELLDAIRMNDADAIMEEAVQVSSTAARIAACLSYAWVRKRSGIVEAEKAPSVAEKTQPPVADSDRLV